MIETSRLVIGPVRDGDAGALRDYWRRNRDHLRPWEPLRDEDWDTDEGWMARTAEQVRAAEEGGAFALVARLHGSKDVAASITFSNIVRGVFQACHLGFSVDAALEGQGVMQEALAASTDWIFRRQHLHRIMAAHLPENRRSAALLARLDFEREGHARDYLKIAGRWRDHVLTAKINPEDRAPGVPRPRASAGGKG